LIFVGKTNLPEAHSIKSLILTLSVEGQAFLLGSVPFQSLPPLFQHEYMNTFSFSCQNSSAIIRQLMATARKMICTYVMLIPKSREDGVSYFFPYDSQYIGRVPGQPLSTPEPITKLYGSDVLRSGIFEREVPSERIGMSLWCWPYAQKKVFTR
jgi:hypothetical protein